MAYVQGPCHVHHGGLLRPEATQAVFGRIENPVGGQVASVMFRSLPQQMTKVNICYLIFVQLPGVICGTLSVRLQVEKRQTMTVSRNAVEEITINPKDVLVSHEVMFTVHKTVSNVYRIFLKMPLEAVLKSLR